MVTNKNVDSITDKNAEANSKLLSPKEWNDLKTKIEWNTATFQERNKYNMILKELQKKK